jgi:hypothetical protein
LRFLKKSFSIGKGVFPGRFWREKMDDDERRQLVEEMYQETMRSYRRENPGIVYATTDADEAPPRKAAAAPRRDPKTAGLKRSIEMDVRQAMRKSFPSKTLAPSASAPKKMVSAPPAKAPKPRRLVQPMNADKEKRMRQEEEEAEQQREQRQLVEKRRRGAPPPAPLELSAPKPRTGSKFTTRSQPPVATRDDLEEGEVPQPQQVVPMIRARKREDVEAGQLYELAILEKSLVDNLPLSGVGVDDVAFLTAVMVPSDKVEQLLQSRQHQDYVRWLRDLRRDYLDWWIPVLRETAEIRRRELGDMGGGPGPKLTCEELVSLANQLDSYTAGLSKLMGAAADARPSPKQIMGHEKVMRAYLLTQLPRLIEVFKYLLDEQRNHLFSRLRNICTLQELPYGEMKRAVRILLNVARQTDSPMDQLEHWYQLLETEKQTADAQDGDVDVDELLSLYGIRGY